MHRLLHELKPEVVRSGDVEAGAVRGRAAGSPADGREWSP